MAMVGKARWKCRQKCGFLNEWDRTNCIRCSLEKNGMEDRYCVKCDQISAYHYKRCRVCGANIECTEMKIAGTPSKLWREQRNAYKKIMIYDVPGKIPVRASVLKSEYERLLWKKARKAIQMCIDKKCEPKYEDEFENKRYSPYKLLKSLYYIDEIGIYSNRSSIRYIILDKLSMVLNKACEMLDINIDELEKHLQEHEAHMKDVVAGYERDPDIVKEQGAYEIVYYVNKREKTCTCNVFADSGSCFHVEKYSM